MQEVLTFILLGFLGGLVRSLYGILKAVNEGEVIKKDYFITTIIIAGLIGGILGYVFDIDFRIATLAGYVGTDILENIFKSSLGESIILRKK